MDAEPPKPDGKSPYERIVGDFRAAKTLKAIDEAATAHGAEIGMLNKTGQAAVYQSIREAYRYYRGKLVPKRASRY